MERDLIAIEIYRRIIRLFSAWCNIDTSINFGRSRILPALLDSNSSDSPFRSGKINAGDGRAVLPKPRNVFLPVVLVIFVLLLVLAVVLSANGGRNLVAMFKALDIPLPRIVAEIAPRPADIDIGVPATAGWPWLTGISRHPELRLSMPRPETMCEALASGGLEAPSFTRSGKDGWECSMLVEKPENPAASSLFLQVRGDADGEFTIIRVKFNLADGRLTEDLSQGALRFLRAAMALPPSEELDDALERKMAEQSNFYFIAGYHALTFRREIDDPNRYNLIGLNRKHVGDERVGSWPKVISATKQKSTIVYKGPRLPAQSATGH